MSNRLGHFLKIIQKGKSPNLVRLASDIFIQANFIHLGSKTKSQWQLEAAESQVGFVNTLERGNKVHLCAGTTGNIIVGTVSSILALTLVLEETGLAYDLSEVQTIDFTNSQRT